MDETLHMRREKKKKNTKAGDVQAEEEETRKHRDVIAFQECLSR